MDAFSACCAAGLRRTSCGTRRDGRRRRERRMAARGYRMVRYADDFVVLCKSREEAEAALAEVGAFVADNGLRLHPDKTHIGDCRNAGEGFEFLGYRFEAGRRLVRKKSLTRLKDRI